MAEARPIIKVTDKRMLNRNEAADYAGMPVSFFNETCPIRSTLLAGKRKRWDKRDIDQWIDDQKEGADTSFEVMLSKCK